MNDETKRRGIINIFLSAIYLWDDKVTLVLNGGNVPIVIEDIPLDEIEMDNEAFVGSRMVAPVPPARYTGCTALFSAKGAENCAMHPARSLQNETKQPSHFGKVKVKRLRSKADAT